MNDQQALDFERDYYATAGAEFAKAVDADILRKMLEPSVHAVLNKLDKYLVGAGFIKLYEYTESPYIESPYKRVSSGIKQLSPLYSTLECIMGDEKSDLVSRLDLSNDVLMIESEYVNQVYVHTREYDKVRLMIKISGIAEDLDE
tara:strand:+ start:399 stop:833 length:435 start_codon:yes stop_codon:yes gene_type:complete